MSKKKKKQTVFDETKSFMIKNYNSNFNFNSLDWTTRSWLRAMARTVERRLAAIEKDIKEKTLF
jgi:hypothetical protein